MMRIFDRKCKFYKNCEYASDDSVTCIKEGGGSYCGHYRVLNGMFGQPRVVDEVRS